MVLTLAVGVLTAARCASHVLGQFETGQAVDEYHAPLYWLDYGAGFVRRGLPGEVLSWFAGSEVSYGEMAVAALAMSAVCLGALVWLAVLLARGANSAAARLAVVALTVSAPFTLSLVTRDLGRYDGIGMIAIVGIVLAARGRWQSAWVASGLAGLAVTVACASEEFLIAFLAPVVLVAAGRLADGVNARAPQLAAVMLGPGAAVSAVSFLLRPSDSLVMSTGAAARAAGVAAPNRPGNDAVSLLNATLDEQLAVFEHYSPPVLVVTTVVLAGVAVLAAASVWLLLGRPNPRRTLATATYLAVVTAVLSVVGVDFLRWWSLAFVAFLGVLAVAELRDRRPLSFRTAVIVAVAMLACAVAQRLPVAPLYL